MHNCLLNVWGSTQNKFHDCVYVNSESIAIVIEVSNHMHMVAYCLMISIILYTKSGFHFQLGMMVLFEPFHQKKPPFNIPYTMHMARYGTFIKSLKQY